MILRYAYMGGHGPWAQSGNDDHLPDVRYDYEVQAHLSDQAAS
jgi:hypothetical protein